MLIRSVYIVVLWLADEFASSFLIACDRFDAFI